VIRKRLSEVLVADASTDLAASDRPILYLQAAQDRPVPRGAWLRIRSAAAHARHATIEGPHFLLQANPDDAAVAIRAFIRDIDADARSPEPAIGTFKESNGLSGALRQT
jgi:pimeloyl-ACP methyl ester carboxylesterase